MNQMQISIILLQITAVSWDLQNQYVMTSYQHRNGFLCFQINCLLISVNCLRLCTSALLAPYINSTNPGHISYDHIFLSWTWVHAFTFFFSLLSGSLHTNLLQGQWFFTSLYIVLRVLACPKAGGSVRYLSVSWGRRHSAFQIEPVLMMHNRYVSWIVPSSLELSFVPFLRQCSGVNSEMKFVCRFVLSWLLRLIHNFNSVSASWIFQVHRVAMRTLKYSSAVSTLIN